MAGSLKDVDLESILKLPQQLEALKNGDKPAAVDILLEENKQLLHILETLQTRRLLQKGAQISKEEEKTAQLLQQNLIALLKWSKPASIKAGLPVHEYISKWKESNETALFKGGLAGKAALKSNQVGPKAFA